MELFSTKYLKLFDTRRKEFDVYIESSLHVFLFAYLSNPNTLPYIVSLTNTWVATVRLDNACKRRKVMGFALLPLPSVKDPLQKVSWGSLYQRPSSLGH